MGECYENENQKTKALNCCLSVFTYCKDSSLEQLYDVKEHILKFYKVKNKKLIEIEDVISYRKLSKINSEEVSKLFIEPQVNNIV